MKTTGDDTVVGPYHFKFESQNVTQFSVNGGTPQGDFDTSAINGFNFPNNGTTKLVVKMGGGADSFSYSGRSAVSDTIYERWFGDVTLDVGAGNNEVWMEAFIARNYTASMGAGDDLL